MESKGHIAESIKLDFNTAPSLTLSSNAISPTLYSVFKSFTYGLTWLIKDLAGKQDFTITMRWTCVLIKFISSY